MERFRVAVALALADFLRRLLSEPYYSTERESISQLKEDVAETLHRAEKERAFARR